MDLIFWQTLICKLARVKDLGKYQTWTWEKLVSFEIVHSKKTLSFILILTCDLDLSVDLVSNLANHVEILV